MDNIDNDTPHTPLPAAAQALVVDGLPPCMLRASSDGAWYVTAQLAAEEQEAPATAAPSEALCQRAQHALGLAGIGSCIAPGHNAIGVYMPTSPAPFGTLLILKGRQLLSTVSHASSETVRALIAAAIEVMRAASAPHTPLVANAKKIDLTGRLRRHETPLNPRCVEL